MSRPAAILLAVCVIGFALAVITGCGTARRAEPTQPPLVLADERLVEGRQVFNRFCHACHPGGEAGLAPSLNEKPLPGFIIRFQVRNGLGAMPSFGRDLISEDELDAVVAYLVTLRRHPG